MRQRVALARSLIIKPSILLLDEPLSALDAKIRQKMQVLLRSLQQKLGLTFIFVTHDQDEALELSDMVAVMRGGRIEQYDSPKNIYDYPVNKWVASFIGDSNIFNGTFNKEDCTVDLLGKTFKTVQWWWWVQWWTRSWCSYSSWGHRHYLSWRRWRSWKE